MNNIIKYSLATLLSFGISSSCLAIVITDTDAGLDNGTNVGGIDTFLAETTDVLSGEAAELAWVNLVLGITAPDTATFTIKTGDVPYYNTNTNDVFAFDATPVSDYFLIKNGNVAALFQNLADFNWGVFDTSLIDDAANLPNDPNDPPEEWVISHVSRFDYDGGGDDQDIPEPGIISLFGIGLLGFGLSHMRRKRKTL